MKRKNTIFNHDQGQGMVEYALLIGLIALVSVAAVTLLFGKTGSATCTKVEDSSSVFTMYEYNKNNDTGIKAIYENVVCILGGWENENIISNVEISMKGPKVYGLIPIASEINFIIGEDKERYEIASLSWDWVDKNGNPPVDKFSDKHKGVPNKHGLHGRPKEELNRVFYHTNFHDNTYVAKLKLKAIGDYEFPINNFKINSNNTSAYGAGVERHESNFINKEEMEVKIYYKKMPPIPPNK